MSDHDPYMNSSEEKVFHAALRYIDDVILRLKETLPEAKIQEIGDCEPRYRFPFSEGTQEVRLRGCMMLKLVQVSSNLNAGDLLLRHGHVYEFMALPRQIMEAVEDIFILGSESVEAREFHNEMLKIFYSEDRGFVNAGEEQSVGKRKLPDVKKRLKALLSLQEGPQNNDLFKEKRRQNFDAFSGHIHGRASAIMHLYVPGRFLTYGLNGVNDYSLAPSYRRQFWNMVSWTMMAAVSAYEKWYGESSDGRSILRSAINASVINPPEGMDI